MVIVKDLKCREYKNSVGISKDLWFLVVEEIIEYGKELDIGDVFKDIIIIVVNKYWVLCMICLKL